MMIEESQTFLELKEQAIAELGDMLIYHGPGHIVFADLNLDSGSIKWCLEEHAKGKNGYRGNYPGEIEDQEWERLRWYLEQLLKMPIEQREQGVDYKDDLS